MKTATEREIRKFIKEIDLNKHARSAFQVRYELRNLHPDFWFSDNLVEYVLDNCGAIKQNMYIKSLGKIVPKYFF